MDRNLQILTVEETCRLTLTNVLEVIGFTDEKIRLTAASGGMVITGEKLKINNFSETTGAFSCEGTIKSITYNGKKENLVKRLFK